MASFVIILSCVITANGVFLADTTHCLWSCCS